MKHRHEKYIKLMADGVRIETAVNGVWIGAYWGDFNDNNLTFRIAPNQPADKDGWIQWLGGENPARGKRIDAKFKGGDCLFNLLSTNFDWLHNRSTRDIVAYRIAKQEKVVLYQWIIYINSDKHPVLTSYFYPDEAALQRVYQNNLKIVHRAEWTRIEVECDE